MSASARLRTDAWTYLEISKISHTKVKATSCAGEKRRSDLGNEDAHFSPSTQAEQMAFLNACVSFTVDMSILLSIQGKEVDVDVDWRRKGWRQKDREQAKSKA